MPTLSRDGVRIYFQDQGVGPPVLLLHAFPLHGAQFQPQIEALSHRYRLIIPDTRGFGQSELRSDVTEMSTIALDAVAILDSLGIPNASVGGVSMGGYAAMALLRNHPQRVKALLLIDTRATADDEAAKKQRERTAQAVLENGMQILIDSMLPKLLSDSACDHSRSAVEQMIGEGKPSGAAAALRGMAAREDSSDILSRFAGPAVVVVGEHDVLTPKQNAELMQSLLSASQLVVIPHAGHLSNLENPRAFNEALLQFLSTCRA